MTDSVHLAAPQAGAASDVGAVAEPRSLVQRLRDTPNWRRESYGHWKDMTSEYDRAPFEAADEIERLAAELDRRKGDPRTRLHNICEAISEERDGSEFSREEWERIDAENVALRASHSALVKALEFYANNLFRRRSDGEPCIQSVIEHDAGDIARNALATAKELT